MDLGLRNRVALISGATVGIGRAVAEVLATEGMIVSICSRSLGKLNQAASELSDRHDVPVHVHAGDLSDPAVCAAWTDAVLQKFGRIDVLVNNASATRAAPVHTASAQIWGEALQLKLFGYAEMAARVFPAMIAARGGSIINIIGTAAIQPSREGGVRTVAATALAGLNKALSNEGASHNIRVNGICPGHTDTHRWTEWLDGIAQAGGDATATASRIIDEIPMGRIALPEDVANAVLFFASDRLSAYVTGTMLPVDGGYVRRL